VAGLLMLDAEAFVSAWLRDQPEVEAVLGDRLYTVLPSTKVWPLGRLTRVGGPPAQVDDGGVRADTPALQVEGWGSTKTSASLVVRTLHATLQGIVGRHPTADVSGLDFGGLRYLPDPTFSPAQPRFLFSVSLTIKPRTA